MQALLGSSRRRLAVLVVAGFAVAGGVAYATIPDSGNVYTACMLNKVGTIRLIDPSLGNSSLMGHCVAPETQISWHQQGQKGEPGVPGKNGTNGTNGVSPTVAQLAAGDPHCGAGGAAITDAAGSTAYVCSGQTGRTGRTDSRSPARSPARTGSLVEGCRRRRRDHRSGHVDHPRRRRPRHGDDDAKRDRRARTCDHDAGVGNLQRELPFRAGERAGERLSVLPVLRLLAAADIRHHSARMGDRRAARDTVGVTRRELRHRRTDPVRPVCPVLPRNTRLAFFSLLKPADLRLPVRRSGPVSNELPSDGSISLIVPTLFNVRAYNVAAVRDRRVRHATGDSKSCDNKHQRASARSASSFPSLP